MEAGKQLRTRAEAAAIFERDAGVQRAFLVLSLQKKIAEAVERPARCVRQDGIRRGGRSGADGAEAVSLYVSGSSLDLRA